MGHVQNIDRSFPLIDLTTEKASSCNHTAQLNLSMSSRDTLESPELIDLTDDDNQYCTSNMPVIDLTGESDQFPNYRIPVIDLTNDDVHGITHPPQCIDLTHNDPFSSDHTIQNFRHGEIDDGITNPIRKAIDLAVDHIQDTHLTTYDTPIVDLTSDSDQFMHSSIPDVNMTDDDILDITHQLHSFDLTNDSHQNINECLPSVGLINHSDQSFDKNLPATDLTSDKDCNNDNRNAIDMIQNEDVLNKLAENEEMFDLSCNNLFPNIHKDVIRSNLRIPPENPCYNVIENKQSQELHRRRELIFRSDPLTNRFYSRKEPVLTNHRGTNNFKERKIIFKKRFEEKGSIPDNPQNNSSDLLKPAHHPIPLRHSLGRSTVNTSQNVPIECPEASEGQSQFLTVSSIIRQKKMKSSSDISKHHLWDSSEPSTSRENSFSYGPLKEVFLQFWIFLLLVFIGLYFWT